MRATCNLPYVCASVCFSIDWNFFIFPRIHTRLLLYFLNLINVIAVAFTMDFNPENLQNESFMNNKTFFKHHKHWVFYSADCLFRNFASKLFQKLMLMIPFHFSFNFIRYGTRYGITINTIVNTLFNNPGSVSLSQSGISFTFSWTRFPSSEAYCT